MRCVEREMRLMNMHTGYIYTVHVHVDTSCVLDYVQMRLMVIMSAQVYL